MCVICLVSRAYAKAFYPQVVNMKIKKNTGLTLMAIWLIANGVISIIGLSFTGLPLIMAVLAIAAGVLILIGK